MFKSHPDALLTKIKCVRKLLVTLMYGGFLNHLQPVCLIFKATWCFSTPISKDALRTCIYHSLDWWLYSIRSPLIPGSSFESCFLYLENSWKNTQQCMNICYEQINIFPNIFLWSFILQFAAECHIDTDSMFDIHITKYFDYLGFSW